MTNFSDDEYEKMCTKISDSVCKVSVRDEFLG